MVLLHYWQVHERSLFDAHFDPSVETLQHCTGSKELVNLIVVYNGRKKN